MTTTQRHGRPSSFFPFQKRRHTLVSPPRRCPLPQSSMSPMKKRRFSAAQWETHDDGWERRPPTQRRRFSLEKGQTRQRAIRCVCRVAPNAVAFDGTCPRHFFFLSFVSSSSFHGRTNAMTRSRHRETGANASPARAFRDPWSSPRYRMGRHPRLHQKAMRTREGTPCIALVGVASFFYGVS